MLKRLALLALLALPLAGLPTAPATAAPKCIKHDVETGVCSIFVEDPKPAKPDKPKADPSDTGGDGARDGDDKSDGTSGLQYLVINGLRCLYMGPALPPPPKSSEFWEGHDDGNVYTCAFWFPDEPDNPMGGMGVLYFWAATPPDGAAPPDPEVLARQAIRTMALSAIRIGIVPEPEPGRIGVIGLPSWMWAETPDEHTIGPITRTASAGGYSVTATGRVTKVVWKMGDGTTVTCTGPGTPYTDAAGSSSSPTCGHTYTTPGQHTVTATSYWTVDWSGIGQTGSIPIDFTQTAVITMGEVQVLVQ